jgi:hypothetical protein
VTFATPEDRQWYEMWYTTNKGNIPEDEKMAGYHERKPDHLLRLSMVLAIAEGKTKVDKEQMIRSGRILKHLEEAMVGTFKWLGIRPIGTLQEKIIRQIKAAGGKMKHSDLLGKMIFYMDAIEFKKAMDTLIQSNTVEKLATERIQNDLYFLKGTGEDTP